METVGTAIISGTIYDTGKILSVNSNFCKILKYDKVDLIKSNINKIVPPYISDFHNKFILNYIETERKHILDKIRILYAIDNSGFIIPVQIYVKIIPNLDYDIRFIGLLKNVDSNNHIFETTEETKNLPPY